MADTCARQRRCHHRRDDRGTKGDYAIPPADQFEENTNGSLEVGKLADLVILDQNLLTIDPMNINKIVVQETIKQDKTVYEAKSKSSTGGEVSVVRGQASYRERLALRPGSVFEASLEDVSRADAPAGILGSVKFEAPGQIPIKFEIPFDPAKIDEHHAYAVRARIVSADGRLMFTTDTVYPVLTRGAGGKVDLLLIRAMASKQ